MGIAPLPELWMSIGDHAAAHARHSKKLNIITRIAVDEDAIFGCTNKLSDLHANATAGATGLLAQRAVCFGHADILMLHLCMGSMLHKSMVCCSKLTTMQAADTAPTQQDHDGKPVCKQQCRQFTAGALTCMEPGFMWTIERTCV